MFLFLSVWDDVTLRRQSLNPAAGSWILIDVFQDNNRKTGGPRNVEARENASFRHLNILLGVLHARFRVPMRGTMQHLAEGCGSGTRRKECGN